MKSRLRRKSNKSQCDEALLTFRIFCTISFPCSKTCPELDQQYLAQNQSNQVSDNCWGGLFITTRTSSFLYSFLSLCLLLTACSKNSEKQIQKRDPSHHGGTATVREPYAPKPDDPATSNDESNDQPKGHFGTVTLDVCNVSSGNCYPLDADVEDGEVLRLYFPKGGWVDFDSSEIDSGGNGSGRDENGKEWEFRGLVSGSIDSD